MILFFSWKFIEKLNAPFNPVLIQDNFVVVLHIYATLDWTWQTIGYIQEKHISSFHFYTKLIWKQVGNFRYNFMNDFIDWPNLVTLLVDHLATRLQNVTAISSGITRRWKASLLNLESWTQDIEMTDRNQEGDIIWNNPRQPNQTRFTEMITETSVKGTRLIPNQGIKTMTEYLGDRSTPWRPTTG